MLKEFSQIIKKIEISDDLYIGYSGGVDSTVLLYLLKKTFNKNIIAIHCNHGISDKSDVWQNHCKSFTKDIGVKLISAQLNLDKSKSIELQARDMRRSTFTRIVPKGASLFLAHHLNDHVETILFRIFRGTGIHGASGIKEMTEFEGINIHRPLLNFKREEIESFAIERGLSWIEDESNADVNIDRNYIRNVIYPAIESKWPKASDNIARFAKLCKEQEDNISESIKAFVDENYDDNKKMLNLHKFYDLELKKKKDIIRHLIIKDAKVAPTLTQIEHIIKDVVMSKDDSCPEFIFNDLVLKKSQGFLYVYNYSKFKEILNEIELGKEIYLSFGECKIINAHKLTVTTSCENYNDKLIVTYGRWGKTGKKIFQRYKIPTWLRSKYPLLYYNNRLIAILGLWVRHDKSIIVDYNKF